MPGADIATPSPSLARREFKAAEAHFTKADRISGKHLKRRLVRSIEIQWDDRIIVERKGKLVRLNRTA